jgi:hypothetical protein
LYTLPRLNNISYVRTIAEEEGRNVDELVRETVARSLRTNVPPEAIKRLINRRLI